MTLPPERLTETHISWVILDDEFVYKIKKPVSFSFLDFSTLAKRKLYCERELVLNRRLTHDMYLEVVPILEAGDQVTVGNAPGEIIDYAVKMRRLPQERQMDIMLTKGIVEQRHIAQIAMRLASFHGATAKAPNPPDPDVMLADFSDLRQVADVLQSFHGAEAIQLVDHAIEFVDKWLHTYAPRMAERYKQGLVIDGHGDLHSKNIFLLDEPVIFDCIEFNDHLRYVDVLDEMAFFCLDLMFFGREDLATYFMEEYLRHNPCMPEEADSDLLHYFQLYRAGVKLKINLIKSAGDEGPGSETRRRNADGYYRLFKRFYALLSNTSGSSL